MDWNGNRDALSPQASSNSHLGGSAAAVRAGFCESTKTVGDMTLTYGGRPPSTNSSGKHDESGLSAAMKGKEDAPGLVET
jgi:hypothetical protein